MNKQTEEPIDLDVLFKPRKATLPLPTPKELRIIDPIEIVIPNPLWVSHYRNGKWSYYTWINGKKVYLHSAKKKKCH